MRNLKLGQWQVKRGKLPPRTYKTCHRRRSHCLSNHQKEVRHCTKAVSTSGLRRLTRIKSFLRGRLEESIHSGGVVIRQLSIFLFCYEDSDWTATPFMICDDAQVISRDIDLCFYIPYAMSSIFFSTLCFAVKQVF